MLLFGADNISKQVDSLIHVLGYKQRIPQIKKK